MLIETRESVFTRPDAGNAESDKSVARRGGRDLARSRSSRSTDILKQVAQKLDLYKLQGIRRRGRHVACSAGCMILVGLANDPNEIPPEERVLKSVSREAQQSTGSRSRASS